MSASVRSQLQRVAALRRFESKSRCFRPKSPGLNLNARPRLRAVAARPSLAGT